MIFKRISLLLLTLTVGLVGCQKPPEFMQAESNVSDVVQRINEARQKSDEGDKKAASLSVDSGSYVDKTPINLAKDPSWMKDHITIHGDQLPFSYFSRTIVGGNNKNVLTHYQVSLDPKASVSIDYSGPVKGALDLLAAKTGYVYSVNGNSIYWQAFITKTFDIAFMPGTADYNLGDSTSGGGTGGTQATGASGGDTGGMQGLSSSSTLKGSLSLWKDLQSTIKTLLSTKGKMLVSQATTTVTVNDRPTNVDLVAQYIKNLNSNLSRQVLVKIQVFEVTLSEDFNLGINWQIIKRGFMGSNFVLNGNYGTPISITPLSQTATSAFNPMLVPAGGSLPAPGNLPAGGIFQNESSPTGVNLLVSALKQQGRVAIVSEPRVVCLNNQVSVIQLVDKLAYVASVAQSSLGGSAGGGVTSSITPGVVTTGLMLYVLPKIMDQKVFLQVNADLSTNLGFVPLGAATTAGTNGVQLPHITEKQFNQRSVINSGETMILSGFRRVANTANAMQPFNSQALGGRGSSENNTETIVLITPIILSGVA